MSKKDKFKFKKRIKEQIIQEMGRAPKPEPPQINPIASSPNQAIAVQSEQPAKIPDHLDFVKYDLKKSAIIIGSIIAAIVIIFFVDNKTGFLLKISDSLFRVLHINA